MSNPLEPTAQLLVKLGSVIVHQEEMLSPTTLEEARPFDECALATVRQDPEVVEWLRQMSEAGYLPVKRQESRAQVESRRVSVEILERAASALRSRIDNLQSQISSISVPSLIRLLKEGIAYDEAAANAIEQVLGKLGK